VDKPTVTFKGKPLTLVGAGVRQGEPAPNFIALRPTLEQVEFNAYRGRPVVLLAVPSLDTSVCDTEVRRFNKDAAALAKDVAVVVLSMDLPFAQGRWCGAHGVERVETLSDHRDAAFGNAYGVLIKELRLLARAAWVIGRDHRIRRQWIVPELTDEPDYAAVLKAAADAAKP
jgi:thiol peroxidase